MASTAPLRSARGAGISPATSKELQRIPGIGPSLARDLFDLGIKRVGELRRRSPERLYEQLTKLRGQHQDRCVLYTFRCAVYFASEPQPDPKLLKWWSWKDAEVRSAKAAVRPKR